jgi:hypothetical protein
MRIDDFWSIAPTEAKSYLDEKSKGEMEAAWRIGLMHHIDPKKYPKRPELLWNPSADEQTVEQMIALAKSWASNTKEVLKKKT